MTDSETDTATEHSLSEQELKTFWDQGFIGPFKVIDENEMTTIWRTERLALIDRANAIYTEEWAVSGNTNISNYDRHMDNDFLADLIMNPRIVDRVASVLGPDVLCWRTEFFPKYPGDEGTDWHQADTFANASGKPQIIWPEDSDFGGTITVWTAFTEATTDNGCLQFIPGSYAKMNYDETKVMEYEPDRINQEVKSGTRRGFFGYDYRQLQIDPEFEPDETNAVPIVLRPGEAVMFWSTLMHASYPHSGKSDTMRLGFASRFVPTSTHIYPDTDVVEEYGGKVSLERYGAVLVSGENHYTHNRIATHTATGRPFRRP
ncbi:MAG: chlorinating enzyme [Streptosporangiaceae bacterium]|jgi:non-heme Fe2+,alpha-ketoglutarate-dependent halogenase